MINVPEYYTSLSRDIGMVAIAPSIDLKNRTVFITGGAEGIGEALSTSIVRQFGGTVIALDIQEDKLGKLEAKLGRDRFIGIPCDLMDSAKTDFKSALTEVCDRFPKIDAYVMNAGVQKIYPYDEAKDLFSTPSSETSYIMKVNADSHLDIFNVLYPYLKQSDAGRIVATSSSVVGRSDLKMAAYILSKEKLTSLARLIKEQVKGTSIFTNVVEPPPVETYLRAFYKNEPLNSNARAVDVIELQQRLISPASDKNGYIYTYGDIRHDATMKTGGAYQYNERTAGGFKFNIRERSLENKGERTIIEGYDSWNSRRLAGRSAVDPIDENTLLRSVFPEPPHITKQRKYGADCQI